MVGGPSSTAVGGRERGRPRAGQGPALRARVAEKQQTGSGGAVVGPQRVRGIERERLGPQAGAAKAIADERPVFQCGRPAGGQTRELGGQLDDREDRLRSPGFVLGLDVTHQIQPLADHE